MVSAAKAFSKEPPRQPLDNLDAIVEDFKWRYVDRKKTDQVVEYCKHAPALTIAIDRAVRARDADGKHHNHQSKVDLTARLALGRALRARKTQIRRIARGPDGELWSRFDALYELVDEVKPYGIGPVTVYDVAVRVGAYLNVEPRAVYTHAGVRQGMRALEEALQRLGASDDVPDPAMMWGAHKLDRVPMYLFPEPLRHMRADDVEDILCTYREVFESW